MSPKNLLVVALSVGLWSCSDPVPPPYQAGVNIRIQSAPSSVTPAGKSCKYTPHSAFVGSPPPSANTAGKRVIAGEDGAKVKCSVRKSGDVFKLTGTASHKAVSFAVTGEVTPGGTGTGLIQHRNNTTLATLESPADQPCTIEVAPEPLQAASGRIWARFSCPALTVRNEPAVFCQTDEGYFVFENCDE